MVQVRLIQPSEWEQAVALSDRTFRDEEHTSMGLAFPHLFSPGLQQSYGAFGDGKLVSLMGLVPTVLRIGAARVDAYELGSVCTDPAYRGKGIAGTILQTIFRHADRAGASLLLVSGGRSLYRRAGCHPFGRATLFTLDASSADRAGDAVPLAGIACREYEPTDWFHLHRLAASRTVRHEQSVAELAELIHAGAFASIMKHEQKILLAERDGSVVAFAIVTVPKREGLAAPRVIEWAGAPSAVAALYLHAMRAYGLMSLAAYIPWHEREMAAVLRDLAVDTKPEDGGHTVKVIDAERLIAGLMPYLRERNSRLAAGFAVRKHQDGSVSLTVNGKSIELSEQDLVSLLFLPGPEIGLDPELTEELSGLFPIPLPYEKGLNYV